MKQYKNQIIIGVDHGYGNIKTANHTFKTGVIVSDTEPVFQTNMLTFDGKYYLIGEGHKEFNADKISDEEYFILTLAAIAMEMNDYRLNEANVHIAAGLPLKWVTQQKKSVFRLSFEGTRCQICFQQEKLSYSHNRHQYLSAGLCGDSRQNCDNERHDSAV